MPDWCFRPIWMGETGVCVNRYQETVACSLFYVLLDSLTNATMIAYSVDSCDVAQ